jgi:hypothetical protein
MAYTLSHKTRSDYLHAVMQHSPAWIRGSMQNPSPNMLAKPSTIALHAIALRRLGEKL